MSTRQHAAVVVLLAAATPLAAMASERFLEMAPCALCLWQRWPYWAAAVLAALAAAMGTGARGARLLLALAGVAVLASGAIAALHVGVEQGWWPSPLPSCAAPTAGAGMSVDDLMRSLAARPAKPCDAAAYPIPGLPVSMAAMNLAYALALGGLALNWSRKGVPR